MKGKCLHFSTEKLFTELILIFLIAFELRTYLAAYIPLNMLTVLYMGTIYALFIFLKKIQYKLHTQYWVKYRFFDVCIICYFILFGFRMGYDLGIRQIFHLIFANVSTYFIYLYGISLAFIFIIRNIDFSEIHIEKVYNILIGLFSLALLYSLYKYIIMNQVGVSTGFRFEANESLDTIGYGHLAVTSLLLCISRIRIESSKSLKFKVFLGILIFLGFISMILANSRSPLLALLIVGIWGIWATGYYRWLIIVSVFISLVVFFINDIDKYLVEEFNNNMLTRIRIIFESGGSSGSSGRDILYEKAVNVFVNHPLLGKSVVLEEGGFGQGDYVHNFFLETLMVLGTVGGILYICFNVVAFRAAWYLMKRKSVYCFFAYYFVQNFVYSMLSRSLLNLPPYWISLALVFACYLYEKRNEKNFVHYHILSSEK